MGIYLWKGTLRLSLIPATKCQIQGVHAIALCQLKTDLTWNVSVLPDLHEQSVVYLHDFAQTFARHLKQEKTMAELLPVYEASLPFYRRLYASGLAKSLGLSMAAKNMLQQPSTTIMANISETNLLT